jgi:hypothetical protein
MEPLSVTIESVRERFVQLQAEVLFAAGYIAATNKPQSDSMLTALMNFERFLADPTVQKLSAEYPGVIVETRPLTANPREAP